MLLKSPKCKTVMKPIHKKYSRTLRKYYFSESDYENCGSVCVVDEEGKIEYVDRDGHKLYDGK